MNSEVNALIEEQRAEWDMCGENYAALETVELRSACIDGYAFNIQFNPKRIQSSAAKVDPKSIKERKCFLCEQNRPDIQRGIAFKSKSGNDYTVLVNPFPIFKKHLTIPANQHQNQAIAGKIGDMLELAGLLTDYLIFYNGPKCGASAPDHFHFQAVNKGFLPIEMNAGKWIETKGAEIEPNVYNLSDALTATIICRTANETQAEEWFNRFYSRFAEISASDSEPMMNILAWKTNGQFYLTVYPRKAHRPTQFFAEGDDNILISPASIDLGGIFITPLKKDYDKIIDGDIKSILQQISITPETLNKLIK